jgi:hypothetical protein
MRESFGDLFHGSHGVTTNAVCITTNGATRSDGAAVMGRGCALQAKQEFPGIKHLLGRSIREHGNHVRPLIQVNRWHLVSYPVKHHWRMRADLALIERSARELMALADRMGWQGILLPRPGCGNGGRDWSREIWPLLESILDDRVVIIARPAEQV